MRITVILLAAVALAIAGCASETSGEIGSGDSDSDTDTDTDTDADTDTDTDTDSDGDPLPPAWFVMDAFRIGDTDEGCDLDEDDEIDNQFSALASFMTDEGYLDEHPNDSIETNIAAGQFLNVLGLTDIHSMVDDTSLTASMYDGTLEDPDAGVPDDLFSGHGSVHVEDTAHTVIEDSVISSSHLETPAGEINFTLSINEIPADVVMYQALLSADIDPLPDEEMLEGGLADGTICGAVDWSEMAEMLSLELGLEPMEQAALAAYLQTNADIDCEDTDCEQISVGLFFSAVSVVAIEP
ncbi:MAG: hypothetical protein JRF63_13960 [Deltaproteobacteria bacterium]|nr:hypothetical protein [Deltaproteobacteria bacterium]